MLQYCISALSSLSANKLYNNKKASFHFHDNYKNDSNKEDFIEALLNDAIAYESHSTIDGFMFEYGYEEPSKAKKVYDACKKQYNRLYKLFSKKEQEELLKELGWC